MKQYADYNITQCDRDFGAPPAVSLSPAAVTLSGVEMSISGINSIEE